MRYINVVITDSIRKINWDYAPDVTVGQVVRGWKFKPIAGTVRAGEMDCGVDLDAVKLSECPQEVTPDGKQMRVRITMETPKPKKKPVVVKENQSLVEEEEEADVGEPVLDGRIADDCQ